MPSKKEYWKNPERFRQATREWTSKNKDRALAKSKQWAEENPDKSAGIKQRYYVKNKELIIERNRIRRRKLKRQCVEYLGGKCLNCGLRDECVDVYCFHHKDPAQKNFTISSKRLKFESMITELNKCELLCCNCHRKKHTLYYDDSNAQQRFRRRRKQMAADLFGGECADCCLVDDPCVYDFHHLDASQKDFSFREYYPWEKTKQELKKCIMVCVNCHRRRHAGRPLQGFRELGNLGQTDSLAIRND